MSAADTVQIHAIPPDQRTPEEIEAWWTAYWEGKVLQMSGPERFAEAMREFHAARAQAEAELRGRQ